MTSFDKRENAFEAEFAHREEVRFKARERAVKLLAFWAAERLGKSGQAGEAYAQDIVAIDVASPEPEIALRRIASDLRSRGVSEQEVRQAMNQFLAQARAFTPGSAS